jgi:hypothetical protein
MPERLDGSPPFLAIRAESVHALDESAWLKGRRCAADRGFRQFESGRRNLSITSANPATVRICDFHC